MLRTLAYMAIAQNVAMVLLWLGVTDRVDVLAQVLAPLPDWVWWTAWWGMFTSSLFILVLLVREEWGRP